MECGLLPLHPQTHILHRDWAQREASSHHTVRHHRSASYDDLARLPRGGWSHGMGYGVPLYGRLPRRGIPGDQATRLPALHQWRRRPSDRYPHRAQCEAWDLRQQPSPKTRRVCLPHHAHQAQWQCDRASWGSGTPQLQPYPSQKACLPSAPQAWEPPRCLPQRRG